MVLEQGNGREKAKEKRTNINDAFCKTVKEDGIHIDSQNRGFGLRVRVESKVFIARAKLRGTRQTILVTIGPYPKYDPEYARKKATDTCVIWLRGSIRMR